MAALLPRGYLERKGVIAPGLLCALGLAALLAVNTLAEPAEEAEERPFQLSAVEEAAPVPLVFSAEERAWLDSHPVLTLSIDDSHPPKYFRDERNQAAGISVDYVRLLEKRLGIRIALQCLPRNEAINKALRREVDGIIGIRRSVEVQAYLQFTEPYAEYPQAVAARRNTPFVSTLEEFNGRTLTVKKGSSQARVLKERYPGINLLPVSNPHEALELLIEGRVDGVYDDLAFLDYAVSDRMWNNVKLVFADKEPPLGQSQIGVRSDEPMLLTILNKAIASITEGEHERIQKGWMRSSIPVPGYSPQDPGVLLSPEEQVWLTEHPKIVVTTDLVSPPYIFPDETGRPCGIIADIAERAEEALGIEVEFGGSNYGALIDAVKQAKADVTTLNDPLDAPYEAHYIKTRDFLFLPYSLWVRQDSALLSSPAQEVQGKRIALAEGWNLDHPFLKAFEGNTLITKGNAAECISAVLSGQADACLEVYSIVDYLQQQNLIKDLRVLNVYYDGCAAAFYVRKDWPEFRSALDKVLGSLSRDEYRAIYERWASYLNDPSLRLKVLDLTTEEREWLRTHPTIRVVCTPQRAPLEFIDESGAFQGVSQEYLTRLGQMLGIRFEPAFTRNWRETLRNLKSGEADMASAIVETPERGEFLSFTAPYLSQPASIFARNSVTYVGGLDQLAGKKVGVVEGELTHERLVKEHPDLQIVPAKTIFEALQQLARGTTDVYVGNLAVTSYYIQRAGLTQIEVVGETPFRYEISMAARKDNPVLLSVLSKALNALPSEERNVIYRKWFTVKYEHGFDYVLLWKIVAGVVVVVGVFIAWNRRLSAVVRARTADLSASNERLRGEIEERKLAEEARRASEELFRALFDMLPYSCVLSDISGRYGLVNKAFLDSCGMTYDEVIGKTPREVGIILEPEMLARIGQDLRSTGLAEKVEVPVQFAGGRFGYKLVTSRLVELNGEHQVLSTFVDISDRKKSEERMRLINECLLSLGANYEENVQHITELCGTLLNGNAALYNRIEGLNLVSLGQWRVPDGYEKEGPAEGHVCTDVIRGGHEGAVVFTDLAATPYAETDGNVSEYGLRSYIGHAVRCGDDSVGSLCVVYTEPAEINEDDKRVVGILAAALGTQEQRHRTEEQLRQAQKMEAVGQLAGGVAHDFNNLLQVINGYTEVAIEELKDNAPVRELLEEVAKAGDRSARLVSQLLAFSRRQVTRPENLAVNDVISGLLKMLGRVLGEHIHTHFVPAPDLPCIHADHGQIEQVLMNLSVNARDAMPEGGTLTIETDSVYIDEEFSASHPWSAPGLFVVVSVTDTGCGMDAEVLQRAFDPFFTTKEIGRGTGLGLATVYGIVRQHLGLIDIQSEVGRGTTFRIYLPAAEEIEGDGATTLEEMPLGGAETILIAEDEDTVREITRHVLERAGYDVIPAQNGEQALRICEERGEKIDLAILDVVMPGMGGRVVYERLKERYPRMRFLFASGYNIDAIHTNYVLNEGFELLQKPFDRRMLLAKVRQQLSR